MSIFAELKRRNVFRVAVVYTVTAWLLAQVAGLAADSFEAPVWVMKILITLLVLVFPLALVFAWAYELTPDGLRRDKDVNPARSKAGEAAGKLDQVILIVLVLAVAFLAFDKFYLDPRRDAGLLESARVTTLPPADEVADPQAGILEKSIAVLPFANMSEDPGNEYFAEGLSEELLNLLVRIPELRVAARTSSFSYKGKDARIAQIGEELDVAHVLEGSVRKAGDRVRITVQLVKADDGFHLWSQTYDRTLDDIFAIQDEIAAAVVDALKLDLLGDVPRSPETDPEVYSLFLQARYFDNLRGEENWAKAESAYQQALTIDPEYAPAWAGLSVTYRYQANSHIRDFDAGMEMARETALHALSLNVRQALAWANLGMIHYFYDWDWAAAEASFDRAVRLEPGNADVLNMAASLPALLGQFRKAARMLETAIELDPLGTSQLNSLGIIYMASDKLDQAEATFRKLLDLAPDYPWGRPNLARALLLKGEAQQALDVLDAKQSDSWSDSWLEFDRALILTHLGRTEEAEAVVANFAAEHGQDGHYKIAAFNAYRGESDAAFESLERALDVPIKATAFILLDPILSRLDNDPRWPVFLEQLNLREAWEAME